MATTIPSSDSEKAIHHVFINLIAMDQDSFKQVKAWFKSRGISSLQGLFDLYLCDPSLVQDPLYQSNDKTQYLDSWMTEKFKFYLSLFS